MVFSSASRATLNIYFQKGFINRDRKFCNRDYFSGSITTNHKKQCFCRLLEFFTDEVKCFQLRSREPFGGILQPVPFETNDRRIGIFCIIPDDPQGL